MTHFDTSNYMPITFTLAYGEHARSHTVYIEPDSDKREVIQTLAGCVNETLVELWREWNDFR